MISPSNPPPLPIPAALTLGAIALAPLIGAAISLAQLSMVPFGYGCVLSVCLYVAYLVGHVVADARKPRSEPYGPRNANCWSCGMEQGDPDSFGDPAPGLSQRAPGRDQPQIPTRLDPPSPVVRERISGPWRDPRSHRGDAS